MTNVPGVEGDVTNWAPSDSHFLFLGQFVSVKAHRFDQSYAATVLS